MYFTKIQIEIQPTKIYKLAFWPKGCMFKKDCLQSYCASQMYDTGYSSMVPTLFTIIRPDWAKILPLRKKKSAPS
jgi:hypothetical protein